MSSEDAKDRRRERLGEPRDGQGRSNSRKTGRGGGAENQPGRDLIVVLVPQRDPVRGPVWRASYELAAVRWWNQPGDRALGLVVPKAEALRATVTRKPASAGRSPGMSTHGRPAERDAWTVEIVMARSRR